MDLTRVLENVIVPRPNGSENLQRVATLIATELREHTSDVGRQPFPATPHGFQLVWTTVFLLLIGYAVCLMGRRYIVALMLVGLAIAALLLEFELLRSPVSGVISVYEDNIVGTFPGRPDGPTLILSAHYDTTTHLGDHLIWYRWARFLAMATALAVAAPLIGLWLRRVRRALPRSVLAVSAAGVLVPYGAMLIFFAVGPLVRMPSPGALDNGGSVAALLWLTEALSQRPADAPTTVKLVFFAAEEERALGSWHYAAELQRRVRPPVIAINLEGIGASERLTYVPEDGFAFSRYQSPAALPRLLNEVARQAGHPPIAPEPLPPATLTDGRSFLAHGIPATTIRGATADGFPRNLHSFHDSRERLSTRAIEVTVRYLQALVAHLDTRPHAAAEVQ